MIGPASYVDDYGDSRPQGRHEGNDIMSVRRALAVAAEAGRVEFQSGSSRAGCMLYLYGQSGTKYVYVHLNNDVTSRNDNRGGCVGGVAFPRGLKSGQRVAAGQPVGYVGDSGDADGAQPHLHFEMRPAAGGSTNPHPYLRRAQRLLFYAPLGSTFTLGLTGTVAETDGTDLRLKVNSLRWWPNGLRVTEVGRTLTLDVSAAIVEQAKGATPRAFAAAKKGHRVTVYTLPQPATREAQLGNDRTLLAQRIVILGD
ncbi:MAG: M23 family metallopeptidase [Thermoleophilia bacterium]|nr:M23 family metallopeptidase [Thermoleophilia bacterium]